VSYDRLANLGRACARRSRVFHAKAIVARDVFKDVNLAVDIGDDCALRGGENGGRAEYDQQRLAKEVVVVHVGIARVMKNVAARARNNTNK